MGEPEQNRSEHRVRRSGAERREQIATAALILMARYGLQGATVNRIADEVGMEAPSLYAHFANRQEILLAAVDVLFDRVGRHLDSSSKPNVVERLRELGENHAKFLSAEFEGFVVPIFEFTSAPRDSGLSQAVGRGQRRTLETLAAYVEEGKRQGTIRADVDPRQVAYEMMMMFWADDITQLMGIDEFQERGFSKRILEVFLRDIATGAQPAQP